MSTCRFPEDKWNGHRFKSFVVKYADWAEAEKISVPQLYYYLQVSSEETDLRKFLESKIHWTPGDVVPISVDVSMGELTSLTTGSTILEKFQHVELLWKYRNSISHEIRELGYGIKLPDDETPFYHSCEHKGCSYWELVYPENFIYGIVKTSLSNLYAWCIENRYNPYETHTFGTLWVK
jgi:hypothetical protein